MSAALLLLGRELSLVWSRGGGPLLPAAFYLALTFVLPLAIGAEPARLATVAPGLAWTALALASLLSLERLVERDFEDGALDLLAVGPLPLELTCAIKALAQWLGVGLPLALLCPVAMTALGAPPALAALSALLALPAGLAFVFVGGVGAALALGARGGGLLIAVVVLPLFAPPVIFGAGALAAASEGLPWRGAALLLTAYSLVAAALSPLAMAAAMRSALD